MHVNVSLPSLLHIHLLVSSSPIPPPSLIPSDPSSPCDPLSITISLSSADWDSFSHGIEELLVSLQSFTDFSQVLI